MRLHKYAFAAALVTALSSTSTSWAGPEIVAGPGIDPACFTPWAADTKYFKWPAKTGPFKIAVVNGFVGNTWRIQMIQTAKAYAALPEIASKISEFKVVSTGNDAPAQLGAIEDFINQGFDGIIINAVTTDGFDRVIRLADRQNVVLVAFDNTLDTDQLLQVNQNQYDQGVAYAQWVIDQLAAEGKTSGKLLEVRGISGNAVDRDRSLGVHDTLAKTPGPWEVVTVNGGWDDGVAQKVVADTLAVHGNTFDGAMVQGGTTGVVQALMAAGHPYIPIGGEAENGYRKLVAAHSAEGLKGLSVGNTPGMVAIGIKAAIAALEGNTLPQFTSIPLPKADYTQLVDGENYWSNLPDNFFTVNEFPPCGVNITGPQIMAQDQSDVK
ncbi:MAG TPA: substrate-binding domain-containing protein [Devosia sp.]|nr:substrate-binding domain-containing protein [Devosia sp.]